MVQEPAHLPPGGPKDRVRGRGTLRGLLVPADESRPVHVIVLRDTAAAFSQVLDGSLLDNTVTGLHAGRRFSFYLQDRIAQRPDNPRVAALAARLGLHDRDVQAHLRGDVLVTGLRSGSDDDCDVPAPVLASADRLGLLPPAAMVWPAPGGRRRRHHTPDPSPGGRSPGYGTPASGQTDAGLAALDPGRRPAPHERVERLRP